MPFFFLTANQFIVKYKDKKMCDFDTRSVCLWDKYIVNFIMSYCLIISMYPIVGQIFLVAEI